MVEVVTFSVHEQDLLFQFVIIDWIDQLNSELNLYN